MTACCCTDRTERRDVFTGFQAAPGIQAGGKMCRHCAAMRLPQARKKSRQPGLHRYCRPVCRDSSYSSSLELRYFLTISPIIKPKSDNALFVVLPLLKSRTRTPSALFPFLGINTIEIGSTPAPAPAAPLPSLPVRFSPTPKPTPILITGIRSLSSVSIGVPITLSTFMSLCNSSTVVFILFVIVSHPNL